MSTFSKHIAYRLLLGTLVFSNVLFCQSDNITSDTLTIEGIVADKISNKPLPYTNIYDKQKNIGTISNLDGYFMLEKVSASDLIQFSFVGYEKCTIKVSRILNMDTIFLEPKMKLLNEVVIFADDSHLYDMVSGCKKTTSTVPSTAKTYFKLETFSNKKQIELVESYYNGIYTGYGVDELNLKNGRLALAENDSSFFISVNVTKALIKHELFSKNEYFPTNPLQLSRNKLKKEYYLKLSSTYKEENSNTIYVIDYKPKDNRGAYFDGKIWIDSLSHNLIKIKLNIKNAEIYPFYRLWLNLELTDVDIEITKTFQKIDGRMVVKAIDFNYDIDYKYFYDSTGISTNNIKSNAVLYAYDYEDKFVLPYFNFYDEESSDYVKILAIPYNFFFWSNINEFKLNYESKKSESFFKDESIFNSQQVVSGLINKSKTIGTFYTRWTENRIYFRQLSNDSTYYSNNQGSIISSMYNLDVQIYLDINKLNDSLHIITKTIFDPFSSYYYLPIDNTAMTFINLYFDIMEIQRRELNNEILEYGKDIPSIKEIYSSKMDKIEMLSQTFFKEVERGTNERATIRWNDYVNEKLGIDNVAIFNPYIKE